MAKMTKIKLKENWKGGAPFIDSQIIYSGHTFDVDMDNPDVKNEVKHYERQGAIEVLDSKPRKNNKKTNDKGTSSAKSKQNKAKDDEKEVENEVGSAPETEEVDSPESNEQDEDPEQGNDSSEEVHSEDNLDPDLGDEVTQDPIDPLNESESEVDKDPSAELPVEAQLDTKKS